MKKETFPHLVFHAAFVSLFLAANAGIYAETWVGLDTNAPISAATGDIAAPVQAVADTGTRFVRVNFILGPWSSPTDTTPHGAHNRTWFQTYDEIVTGFTSRGVEVYGLIGGEAVKSGHSLNSDGYVTDYVNNFVQIVDHFKDRIQVYESFNEPNDWAGGTSAQVKPYWFAKMLEQIYREVRINNGHASDPAWQVTLVSGPLFSHDLDTVAPYFGDVYTEGIQNLGWSDLKTNYGTYPLDGIGYHIYVAQGTTNATTIQQKMNGNLDAIWGVITANEGTETPKKLWISEFGWRTDSVGGETEQARNMQTGFDLLLADTRIQLAVWFCLKDFPNGYYGLFRISGVGDEDKKPAWHTFHAIATGVPTPTPTPSPTPTPTPTHTPTPTPTPPYRIQRDLAPDAPSLPFSPDDSDPLNGNVATRISGGFHPDFTTPEDQEPAFTDGKGPTTFGGLLRDYPGENTPAWSGLWSLNGGESVDLTEIRVFSGNIPGKDGRVFHHYDLYTTDDPAPSGSSSWTLRLEEVLPADFGTDNSGKEYAAALTVLTDYAGGTMIPGVTAIRIDFYSVSGMNSMFMDDWDDGNGDDRDNQAAAFESPLVYEVDAYFPTPTPTATPTPTTSPSPTPTQTPSPTPTPSATPSPSPTPSPTPFSPVIWMSR